MLPHGSKNSGLFVLSEQQLRAVCTQNNLEADGTREQLVQRIIDANIDTNELDSNEFKDALEFKDNEFKDASNMFTDSVGASSSRITVRRNDIRFEDIKSCFKTFKGDKFSDVNVWVAHFERQCETYDLNALQRFAFVHRLFTDRAKLFVEYESKATTWIELKYELLVEFGAKTDSIIVHERLRQRKKSKQESVMEYMYDIIGIATQGNVDEASIVRYVIDGLPGNAASKSFMYEARTIYALKTKLETYEYVCVKFEGTESRSDNKGQSAKHSDNEKKYSNFSKKIRCFGCGGDTHTSNSVRTKTKARNVFRATSLGIKVQPALKKR